MSEVLMKVRNDKLIKTAVTNLDLLRLNSKPNKWLSSLINTPSLCQTYVGSGAPAAKHSNESGLSGSMRW